MSRTQLIKTVTTVWMAAFVVNVSLAQSPAQPALLPTQVNAAAARPVSGQTEAPMMAAIQPQPGQAIAQYPYTGAAMYPSPVPHVPYQVGGTMITNQAFNPHEMLYPHQYKALYPPFYYKVRGGWTVTPWGVRSYDVWKLEGTMVKVKYKPRYSMFSGFVAPH